MAPSVAHMAHYVKNYWRTYLLQGKMLVHYQIIKNVPEFCLVFVRYFV
jgi:hypothetical protein